MIHSDNQNKSFHKLLEIFNASGCSSFLSYEELRNYYKKYAGLIEVEYKSELSQATKNYLWTCIKHGKSNGILDGVQYNEVVELLRGKTIIHKSWSSVSKKKATQAIDKLISDMFESGVDSSSKAREFETVLKGMSDD